jgi:hypothetical protein
MKLPKHSQILLVLSLPVLLVGAEAEQVVIPISPNTYSGPYTVLEGIAGGYSIVNLFEGLPNATRITWWDKDTQHFRDAQKVFGNWSFPKIFQPGEGFFIQRTFGTNITWSVERTGAMPQITLVSNQYVFVGSYSNGPATYEDIVGAPPQEGTTLMRHISGAWFTFPNRTNWTFYHFTGGTWMPSMPIMSPLESVVIINPTLQVQMTSANDGAQFVLSWPRGKLEAAPGLPDSWQEVFNAEPPFVVDPSSEYEMRVFRAREDEIAY